MFKKFTWFTFFFLYLAGTVYSFNLTISTDSVNCNGGSDGKVFVNVINGGVAPFTFSWSPPTEPDHITNNPSDSLINLSAGLYWVVVTDATLETKFISAFVNEPPVLSIDSETKTDITCNGLNDGTITITASGGTTPYRYSIDAGVTFVSNGGIFTGLSAGNYDDAVTDYHGCTALGNTLTIVNPAPLSIDSESKTDVSCNGGNDGTITITASGGTPPYEYSVDGGTNFVANNGNFTGLFAGTYQVVVRDVNFCSQNGSLLTLTQPPAISIDSQTGTDISCNGLTDGTISVTASGGTGALQYTLNPGGTTNGTGNFTNLTANTYTVDVTDANGCGPVTTA
ncbi:MAG: hypothetical protein GXO83_12530, partial [Chlorobi bacterium]|nr:hypothetical protein [Chlorobiota bacterium]